MSDKYATNNRTAQAKLCPRFRIDTQCILKHLMFLPYHELDELIIK